MAMLDNGVLGFWLMWASKGDTVVVFCGVILNVFMISATSEANLYGSYFHLFA